MIAPLAAKDLVRAVFEITRGDSRRLRAHGPNPTQHLDRPSYTVMAFCQSIISLVVHLGLIGGSGHCGRLHKDRPASGICA
jgi:hypothetical protein